MDIYDIIKNNKGIISVQLEPHTIYCILPRKYTLLHAALRQSMYECISTSVVDVLLKSSIKTINTFIKALKKTKQDVVAEHFTKVDDTSDTYFRDYTAVIDCNEKNPKALKLMLNYICLVDVYDLHSKNNLLRKLKIISYQSYCIIEMYLNMLDTQQATRYLLDIIINGNKKQYEGFVEMIKAWQPNILPLVD